MSAEQPLPYLPKRRVANFMAGLFIIWTLSIWTWIIYVIMQGQLTVTTADDGSLLIALNPAVAIVTSILAMLNVALGMAIKHLWDTASHD